MVAHKTRHMPQSLLLPLQAESQFWAHLTIESELYPHTNRNTKNHRIIHLLKMRSECTTCPTAEWAFPKDREIHAGNCTAHHRAIGSPSKCFNYSVLKCRERQIRPLCQAAPVLCSRVSVAPVKNLHDGSSIAWSRRQFSGTVW